MHVRLTVKGQLVTDQVIPPFITPPDVLMWGTRVFHITDESEVLPSGERRWVYNESFFYAIVPIESE